MNNLLLFEDINIFGKIPYKNYNCSIIKLDKEETLNITNNIYNIESILIVFFLSSSNKKRYGSFNFIGIINLNNLLLLFEKKELPSNEKIWIIKPHLLQNDKGPKYADIRLFKTKNSIGTIGYSRLACKSNTKNIADYYVRASILETKKNDDLYLESKKLYSFFEIDGGCFPEKIYNNYKKFEISNKNCDNDYINNIEFYIKNNDYAKLVYPHDSKDKNMPNKIQLNGIEVSFSKKSTNEDKKEHISTKNIVPIQHLIKLNDIGFFIDYSPPNSFLPLLTCQDLNTSKVHYTDNLIIDKSFYSKDFRGSTPFIQIDESYFFTIVHKRISDEQYFYNIKYDYFILLFDAKSILLNNNNIIIPCKCLKEKKIDLEIFKKDFIYITGLILLENNFNKLTNIFNLNILISYGISDNKSGISNLKIKL